jgi:predicted RNase H-like HicB family nuclease
MPMRYPPAMTYRVLLIETEEGFAVGCPSFPGCWTQGASREEALENIRIAIREVLEVKHELEVEQWREEGLRVETVSVDVMAHA